MAGEGDWGAAGSPCRACLADICEVLLLAPGAGAQQPLTGSIRLREAPSLPL